MTAISNQTKVVLLPIHGQGKTPRTFADRLEGRLRVMLGEDLWAQLHVAPLYYQDVLQDHQDELWERSKRGLRWRWLRRLFLFGFSDAAALERVASRKGSPYHRVQQVIRETLLSVYGEAGRPIPVVVIAQSLGCQVISNYVWDAQKAARKADDDKAEPVTRGIWRWDGQTEETQNENGAPGEERGFVQFRSLKFLYTTGCNIPIFLAGFPRDERVPFHTRDHGYQLVWKNFYSRFDPLGWPLRPLSTAYKGAVDVDRRVGVGGVLRSWNPGSHGRYWTDEDVVAPLADDLLALLGGSGV